MKKLEDGTYTVKKTIEDYEKLVEEQKKALKILNKRLRDKEKKILELNKQKRHLRKARLVSDSDMKRYEPCIQK